MGGTETMNKTQQAITASLAGLVMLLAVSPAFAADAEVKIANFTFDPPVLTVKAGTTVTWVNALRRARYRRQLLAVVRNGGNRRIFLLHPPAYDGKDHRHTLTKGLGSAHSRCRKRRCAHCKRRVRTSWRFEVRGLGFEQSLPYTHLEDRGVRRGRPLRRIFQTPYMLTVSIIVREAKQNDDECP